MSASIEQDDYLSRCQVDTPPSLVRAAWRLVRQRRRTIGHVIDFGCGDGRFAHAGSYETYTGVEIDAKRVPNRTPALNAKIKTGCAFRMRRTHAAYAVSIQNPPYVRHHDLSLEWIKNAEGRLKKIEGYAGDGRANAFIYFMWLGIDAVADDGLAAFIVPYEWVSCPG